MGDIRTWARHPSCAGPGGLNLTPGRYLGGNDVDQTMRAAPYRASATESGVLAFRSWRIRGTLAVSRS